MTAKYADCCLLLLLLLDGAAAGFLFLLMDFGFGFVYFSEHVRDAPKVILIPTLHVLMMISPKHCSQMKMKMPDAMAVALAFLQRNNDGVA